jgi:putative OPT family oligopeptide transporter
LNFAGGVLAWGLMVPMLLYFLGPQLQQTLPAGAGEEAWEGLAQSVWRFIVRPIAVGGMLVGAGFTLFRMRKSLAVGLGKAVEELRMGAAPLESVGRTERYMSSKTVFLLIGVVFVLMIFLYMYLSGLIGGAILAACVMLVIGFFFATVSGYLVGVIGSTNNPISGITLSTLIIAALLMVSIGVSGASGVLAVLGVAAVVCVSSAVAGELLQDFKVGYILGGTPRTIQIVELIAVMVASLAMYYPLLVLHEANIREGGIGFGDRNLSAPQAGLMALLAQGIVGGQMAWPLVAVGVAMGLAMIMAQVRSPMLVAVGMYLPVETTFAIFLGGVIRWVMDTVAKGRRYNEAQMARVENVGILCASGMIAGEALVGLAKATYVYFVGPVPAVLANPLYVTGLLALAMIVFVLVRVPVVNAGSPDEPAPPTAMM